MYKARGDSEKTLLSEIVKGSRGMGGEKLYSFLEAGDGGVYWVEILLVASGRKLSYNWFRHKGNLLDHVNKKTGVLQIQVPLDAGVAKLSWSLVPCTSPVCVVLILRWAFPLSQGYKGSSRPHISASYPAGKRKNFSSPAIIQKYPELGDMFI